MPRLEDLPPEVVADAVSRAVVEAVAEGGGTETIVGRALSRVRSELRLSGNPAGDNPRPSDRWSARPTRREAGGANAGTGPPAESTVSSWGRWSAPQRNGFRPAPLGSGKLQGGGNGAGGRVIITEGDVLSELRNGRTELRVPRGAILTALARDAARDAGLLVVEEA